MNINAKEQITTLRLSLCVSFDEFNDFLDPAPKHVQTTYEERRGSNSKTKRRVARSSRGRETMTVAVVFSIVRKGPVLIMVNKCSREEEALINRDFKDRCVLRVGNKWMNGAIHSEFVLPKLVVPFATRLRSVAKKPDSSCAMYMEDECPGHVSERCPRTKKKGLKEKRRALFKKANIIRHLYSRNGTPEQCWNDQVHQLIKHQLHQALRTVKGESPIMRLRPRGPLALRPGGVYRTDANARRSPTKYLYVKALVEAWERFPQTDLMAGAVRTGHVTAEEAARAAQTNLDSIKASLKNLTHRQAALAAKRLGTSRLNPDCDFSGALAVKSLDGEKVDAVTEAHGKAVKAIVAACTPQALLGERGGAKSEDDVLQTFLQKPPAGMGSTLLNVGAKPHAGNVGEFHFFEKVFKVLFGSQKNWTKMRAGLRDQICEWHYVKLKEGYGAMVVDKHPAVFIESRGKRSQVTFSRFVWDIFAAIHAMCGKNRFQKMQTIICDYKTLSLNPRGVQLGKFAAGEAKKCHNVDDLPAPHPASLAAAPAPPAMLAHPAGPAPVAVVPVLAPVPAVVVPVASPAPIPVAHPFGTPVKDFIAKAKAGIAAKPKQKPKPKLKFSPAVLKIFGKKPKDGKKKHK